jgi:CheY-like chemotaxis protein
MRGTGGLGLGLFIVKHLVELHGGVVTASSDGPGTGATFVVRLPLRPGYVEPAPAEAAVPHASGHELEGRRVIVVDDDEDTREILAAMLRAHGASSWVAPDIASALALVETQQPHVIISDIGLHDEDGCALAQQVHERFPGTMSIALSGFADSAVRDQAIASGFKRFLAKPVETSALLEAVLQSAY